MIKKLKWLVIISVVLVALGTVGIGIASVYHMKYALKSLFNMEFNTGSDFWAYGDISSYNKNRRTGSCDSAVTFELVLQPGKENPGGILGLFFHGCTLLSGGRL